MLKRLSRPVVFLLSTVFLLWLCHVISAYAHEFGHSFTAWLLGFKSNPLDIDYGGMSWQNLAFLIHIDEQVNYKPIFAGGHHYAAALIAFMGTLVDMVLFAIALRMVLRIRELKTLQHHFWYWFCLVNLANVYAYIPIRVFSQRADMGYVMRALDMTSWQLMFVAGYLVLLAVGLFFARLVPRNHWVIAISVFVLFGYFAGAAYMADYGVKATFMMQMSWYAMPLVFVACLLRRQEPALRWRYL